MFNGKIIAHHGINYRTARAIENGSSVFVSGTSDEDWLGTGIYFWLNNIDRAKTWILDPKRIAPKNAVIEIELDLGYCLYVHNIDHQKYIEDAYYHIERNFFKKSGNYIKNSVNRHGQAVARPLDCAVMNAVRQNQLLRRERQFQSALGIFEDGKPIFPGSSLRKLSHIQICVFDPKLIPRKRKIVWHD